MKVGFVNGCFDILHIGHKRLFEFAKNNCDYLIVGIDSDQRVKELKGDSRPLNCQYDRKEMLESIKYIDKVEIFNSEKELINLVKVHHPAVMFVGSDYKEKNVIGSQHAKKLIFFERIDGYSSTKAIKDITNRRNM